MKKQNTINKTTLDSKKKLKMDTDVMFVPLPKM